jgi:virginiamycin B lyase
MRATAFAVAAAAAIICVTETLAQVPFDINAQPVPFGGRPRDPYVDAQDRVWFVGQAGNYIAYFDTKNGEFKKYEIEAGTNPHNLIIDKDGFVWYSGNRNGRIGRLDPKTGELKIFMIPDTTVRDPHTMVFDSKGDIWFTAQNSQRIGKLTVATGEFKLFRPSVQRSNPYGIKMDSQDRPWIVLFATNKLATVDPKTMEYKEVDLPRPGTRPRRIEITSDDMIWYVDHGEGYLGRYNPKTGEIKEWPAPSGAQSRPYAMAGDDQDRIWFVETGVRPNKFVGFDPRTEKFFSVNNVPGSETEPNAIRHMFFQKKTGQIWFGMDLNNSIGRAVVRPVVTTDGALQH